MYHNEHLFDVFQTKLYVENLMCSKHKDIFNIYMYDIRILINFKIGLLVSVCTCVILGKCHASARISRQSPKLTTYELHELDEYKRSRQQREMSVSDEELMEQLKDYEREVNVFELLLRHFCHSCTYYVKITGSLQLFTSVATVE